MIPPEIASRFRAHPETHSAPSQNPPPRPLLDDIEVAARLHVAVQTVRNWRARGEGPRSVKLGKRSVRYRPEDVDAFIAGEGRRA